MDLTTWWDFSKSADRKRAKAYIEKHRPRLVLGSPCCTAFSQLQALNPDSPERQRKWREGCRHIQFMAEVYLRQIEEGRWFLHEHPAYATSWKLKSMLDLQKCPGVMTTIADQCMYGLLTNSTEGREAPARKSTKFMTNSQCLVDELKKRCDRTHQHQPLIGGRAKRAAMYPEGLCQAIRR